MTSTPYRAIGITSAPKKERLEILQKESNQIKTEIEALELAISTIKNN